MRKVAKIVGRSYSLITYIARANNFKQYCNIRPGGKNDQKETKKTSMSENIPVKVKQIKVKQTMTDESKAILAELVRIRKASFANYTATKSLRRGMLLSLELNRNKQTLPLPKKINKTDLIINLIMFIIIMALIVWVFISFL